MSNLFWGLALLLPVIGTAGLASHAMKIYRDLNEVTGQGAPHNSTFELKVPWRLFVRGAYGAEHERRRKLGLCCQLLAWVCLGIAGLVLYVAPK
jgi:hypothetical protein